MARTMMGDGFDFNSETQATDLSTVVKFKYRPPLPVSLARFDRLSMLDADGYANGYAEFLAENIGEWDIVDEKDVPVPVCKESFLKCRDWNLLNQLKTAILKSDLKAKDQQKKS